MKKFILYIISAVVILLSLTHCSEDFLDRTPTDKISTSTFFTQEKDLVFALNAAYDAIGGNSWGERYEYGYGTDLLRVEVLTDNAIDHHSWNACYDLANGTATSYDWYAEFRWLTRYKGIQRVNRILEGANGVQDIDEDYKACLLAEALFLRAYFYFDLVYLFGDVPFLTNSITADEAMQVTREDADIILDAIVADLDQAALALPDSYSDDDIGRATKGAAYALKARILLYQEEWEEAANAAQDVMDLNVYSLYPDYQGLFDYSGIGCEEVIFDIQVIADTDEEEFFVKNYGPNSVGGWSCSCPLQSMVDEYECIDGNTIDVSPLYVPGDPYANRDPRLEYSILYPGHAWQGGVYNTIPGATYPGQSIIAGDDLTDGTGGQWNKTPTGYNWLKYMSQQNIDEGTLWYQTVHLILIRYADVLLMYAEAKIEADDIDASVLNAINQVRNRVGMPDVTTTNQTDLREIVRRERRVELAFEGLRLMDIRRWRIAEDVMPGVPEGLTYVDPGTSEPVTLSWGTRTFDPNKHYLWPIPQTEIDISGIEQNLQW